MRTVFAYDIVGDGRRARLFKRLKRLMVPVQKSVFEGHLPPRRLMALESLILRELDPNEDQARVYTLCRSCAGLVRSYGVAPELGDPDAPLLIG